VRTQLFVLAIAAPLYCCVQVYQPAMAQAGSTGGTVGNRDKSVSGGEEQPPHAPNARERIRAPSIAGLWRWTIECGDGHYNGVFEIMPSSNGQFTGNFIANDVGSIEDGYVNGSSISFIRRHPIELQHWSGHLEGGHISGSLSSPSHGKCEWQASR
jgi:hypothetical protein